MTMCLWMFINLFILIDDEYELITGFSKTQLFPCIEYLNDYYDVIQAIKINDIYTSHKVDETFTQEQEFDAVTNDNSVLNVDSFVSKKKKKKKKKNI